MGRLRLIVTMTTPSEDRRNNQACTPHSLEFLEGELLNLYGSKKKNEYK